MAVKIRPLFDETLSTSFVERLNAVPGIICVKFENDIDMPVLPTLTEDDLPEIGVKSFGQRRKLRIVCEEMKKKSNVLPVLGSDKDSCSTVSSLDDSMNLLEDDSCGTNLGNQPATSTSKRQILPTTSGSMKSPPSSDSVVA